MTISDQAFGDLQRDVRDHFIRISEAEDAIKRVEQKLIPEVQQQQNRQAVELASLRGLLWLSIAVSGFGFIGVMVVLFFVVQVVTYFRVVP